MAAPPSPPEFPLWSPQRPSSYPSPTEESVLWNKRNLAAQHHHQQQQEPRRRRPLQESSSDDCLHRIILTWKDVSVSVSNPEDGHSRFILQGLTGYAQPGEVLAILGPSGAGKSTLLDMLAGRLTSSATRTGEILVNGRKQPLSHGSSAYVTQDDSVLATLTVREAVFYSAQLQLPNNMSIEEKRDRAESAIKDMGLQDAANTRIGGWRSKGLSGGEKRRVSIATECLTRPSLLFLDEPTSGLDSAAAFHVMKTLRRLAVDGRTVIASVHQPSGDVFELFHALCLLSAGRTVYFGEVSGAREFFSEKGFPCPSLRNPPEHYLRIINQDFERVIRSRACDVEQGSSETGFKTEQVIQTLVEAYKRSEVALAVAMKLNEVTKVQQQQGAESEMPFDHANFFTQVCVLTRRSFKNMYRDIGYYWFRFAIHIFLSLAVGSIFYKVGHSYSYRSIQKRVTTLMCVVSAFTFMAIGGFPSFVEEMKVFRSERLNGHYGVASFVVANTLSSSPYLLLISSLPSAILYFLADLHHGFSHFLYFILTLYACMLLIESMMMAVASIVPDFLMGIIAGAGLQSLFLLTGGFFVLPQDMPKPVWRYPVSYMGFHTYANQGFYKNDFEGLTFDSNVGGTPPMSGTSILRDEYQVSMSYSKWVDFSILLGMAVGYRAIFFSLIKLREHFPTCCNMLFIFKKIHWKCDHNQEQ